MFTSQITPLQNRLKLSPSKQIRTATGMLRDRLKTTAHLQSYGRPNPTLKVHKTENCRMCLSTHTASFTIRHSRENAS